MGACGSKLQTEPIINAEPEQKSNDDTTNKLESKHLKLLIMGYLRICIENNLNLNTIIPNEIKQIITHFYCIKTLIVDVLHRKTENNINGPIRHIFHLYLTDNVSDLAKQIGRIYDTYYRFVTLSVKHSNGQITTSVDHSSLIDSVPNNYPLSCIIHKDWNNEFREKEIKERKLELREATLCHITLEPDKYPKPRIFGIPFVVSHLNIATHRELYQHIYERLFMWMGYAVFSKKPPYLNKAVNDEQYVKPSNDMIEQYEQKWDVIFIDLPFKLRIYDQDELDDYFPFNDIDKSSVIPIDDTTFNGKRYGISSHLFIEWNRNTKYEIVRNIINKVIVSTKYKEWKRNNMDIVSEFGV